MAPGPITFCASPPPSRVSICWPGHFTLPPLPVRGASTVSIVCKDIALVRNPCWALVSALNGRKLQLLGSEHHPHTCKPLAPILLPDETGLWPECIALKICSISQSV